ncbi:HsdR family type I site-specific deoxyribonuclease [Mesorhizobium sp. CA18]|uniref:type I restriction endonuclease subunit R n=1 Tax=unclassified Mesorhizobium TaxID=325217 RepID=UPI001CCF9234|nr:MULTISPECIES: HsdR family type I site-specific deoxyribonuclease [unclassified Mesorhizobium]MBZ9734360.1 HsdR family type I site-specific deoxyribonuclease [Mesorhizobium sp. CA9]MBZ9824641.1 HsdR family type I site-specific deoxyribonuclease [Mesorhizobium sp. CA18]MBZ9829401.1 HsdR family type I site-specific deoxyribonuclease [Mesorhizobium sp. CA2]MBZ9878009.1 HsdR family type I site-specific deoxyribonuclease [Mesorhizobium sp. Ca11]MBZ9902887.1 HsdR family type I site-specific deoxyr
MNAPERPRTDEETQAKVPALALLTKLGWSYLSPQECLRLRGSERAVLLDAVIRDHLSGWRFAYRGASHALSPSGIAQVLKALSNTGLNEGLTPANERVWKHLALGATVTEFMPDGHKHSVTVPLLDFANLASNRLQVTEELSLEREGGHGRFRPDIVLYVNGIPLAVIEAKRPTGSHAEKQMLAEGVSQHLRNQKPDGIPALYAYAQLVLSISGQDGKYATTETPAKFWSMWREEDIPAADIDAMVNTRLRPQQNSALFAERPAHVRAFFDGLWSKPVAATGQDQLIVSLLRPDRLLEFVRYFLLFDRKLGKIAARYPQVFGIKSMLTRMERRNRDGGREGGVIWHTTGSGKSFTMVFLLKALLIHDALARCRIIVVTDRVDLERQLSATFMAGGAFGSSIATKKDGENAKAFSGRDLARRIGSGTERIMFTLLQKFNSATRFKECHNGSQDLIVLVDEGHRSHGGENHERMRKALPNAAFIAFTGTPLLKHDKTQNKFGPILHAYTMQRAVEDGTVTPLLYEERQPVVEVNAGAIDKWFDKITTGLSDKQQSDLKKKFATRGSVYRAGNRIDLIAWDIATHFSQNFKELGTGLKAQLATDSKLSAIRYKQALDATGLVTSAVIISPPDTREGHEDTDEAKTPEVQKWWAANVGNDPEGYERRVIEDFATPGKPDILIVVDKLLTGFDEPRNAVLYIDKYLKEHNLLQAIARVNRLHEAKQFGFLIDYRGILTELDTSLKDYQDLAQRTQGGYDIEDIEGTFANVATEYKRLPGLHAALWAIFAGVKNKGDREQFRLVLTPDSVLGEDGASHDRNQKVREDFYAALTEFGMCLKLALSSRAFFEDGSFSEATIADYKKDLKFFTELRIQAKQDAMETVDFSAYEEQIRKLVDKQVVGVEIKESEGVIDLTGLAEGDQAGYDASAWSDDKTRAETDVIKTRLTKTIEQTLADDPYAQAVFSDLLRQAIKEAEALFDHPHKQYILFKDLEEKARMRANPHVPDRFPDNPHAQAYFGLFPLVLGEVAAWNRGEDWLVAEAFHIDSVVSNAVASFSINPANIEAEIRKQLLPRYFKALGGLDKAQALVDRIVEIVRLGASRGTL